MSTLRVSAVNNAAASVGGLAIDSSGNVTGALPSPNRNLLYNGAMQVSQRGTSTTSITTGGYYTADRWTVQPSSLGTWTNDIQTDAPTGSGFRRSLRLLCTTADAAPAAGDYLIVTQVLEGQDVQRIRKGTSSAQKLTLSFWVKSNVTGTYVAELQDVDNSRFVSASYSISASATWEKKTITFPADTTGAFDNDNAGSLQVYFWLGAGSTFSGGSPLQTAWGTATNTRATGQTNLASATNNYWQITGVQLEVGDVATDFEFKSYGQELRECQRYYFRRGGNDAYEPMCQGWASSTTRGFFFITPPVTLRSKPSAVEYASLQFSDEVSSGISVTSVSLPSQELGTGQFAVSADVASGLTQYRSYTLRAANSTGGYIGVSAEL